MLERFNIRIALRASSAFGEAGSAVIGNGLALARLCLPLRLCNSGGMNSRCDVARAAFCRRALHRGPNDARSVCGRRRLTELHATSRAVARREFVRRGRHVALRDALRVMEPARIRARGGVSGAAGRGRGSARCGSQYRAARRRDDVHRDARRRIDRQGPARTHTAARGFTTKQRGGGLAAGTPAHAPKRRATTPATGEKKRPTPPLPQRRHPEASAPRDAQQECQ